MSSDETMAIDLPDHGDMPLYRFLDRELSWLAFNQRVLELAEDKDMFLLERVNFLAIFASNLDEFFMVRMASLKSQVDAGITTLSDDGHTPQQQIEAIQAALPKLLEMQQNGELAQLNADVAEQHELTERLKADMGSDSWLSKNIRPMTLIAILIGYFTFAGLSAAKIDVNSEYVQLLGQWGMLIMSAYFGGRTLEKIMDKRNELKP